MRNCIINKYPACANGTEHRLYGGKGTLIDNFYRKKIIRFSSMYPLHHDWSEQPEWRNIYYSEILLSTKINVSWAVLLLRPHRFTSSIAYLCLHFTAINLFTGMSIVDDKDAQIPKGCEKCRGMNVFLQFQAVPQ